MLVHPIIIFVLVYSVLEFTYLSLTSKIYKSHFAQIQRIPINKVNLQMLPYGILCYIVVFAVVWYFVIRDIFYGPKNMKVSDIMTRATLLALAMYGVYNFTNAATLANYSTMVMIQDIIWGVLVVNATALVCFWVKKYDHGK